MDAAAQPGRERVSIQRAKPECDAGTDISHDRVTSLLGNLGKELVSQGQTDPKLPCFGKHVRERLVSHVLELVDVNVERVALLYGYRSSFKSRRPKPRQGDVTDQRRVVLSQQPLGEVDQDDPLILDHITERDR